MGPLDLLASNLLAARQQMAFTLGFHIVLASMGVAFPAITLIAHYRGIRGDEVALGLARRWSKVMAVLFAVGVVTGTVLSFELGILWPGLMDRFGDVFGLQFAIEGIFFFTEAIFVSIYLLGWDRLPPRLHLLSGLPIVVAGLGGAWAVVTVNAWMNTPTGYTLGPDGQIVDVDPWAVMTNDAMLYEVVHMILAAYIVAGFLVASVYAVGMLKGRRDRHHRVGFLIPFTVAAIVTPIQLIVGDTVARQIASDQPIKFAAQELVLETGDHVPETLGGLLVDDEVRFGVDIPDLASILVGGSPDTEIVGLDTVPPDDRPPVNIVHLAFDVMVGAGTALALLAAWFGLAWWRRRDLPRSRWFLRAASMAGLAALAALWSGWVVTEVGRQPWIVYEVMRTEEAVTDADGLWFMFAAVVALYAALAAAAIWVLRLMAARWRSETAPDPAGVPYERHPRDRRARL